MAREGAYSKATASAVTEAAEMPPEEQRSWAGKLLPGSGRPEQAYEGVGAGGAELGAEDAPQAAASRIDAVGDELCEIRCKPQSGAGGGPST